MVEQSNIVHDLIDNTRFEDVVAQGVPVGVKALQHANGWRIAISADVSGTVGAGPQAARAHDDFRDKAEKVIGIIASSLGDKGYKPADEKHPGARLMDEAYLEVTLEVPKKRATGLSVQRDITQAVYDVPIRMKNPDLAKSLPTGDSKSFSPGQSIDSVNKGRN